MKLIKLCKWCNAEMVTTRSSKLLCSRQCHNQMHYWRHKNYPGEGPAVAFKAIDNLLCEGSHPNSNHPINAEKELKTMPDD